MGFTQQQDPPDLVQFTSPIYMSILHTPSVLPVVFLPHHLEHTLTRCYIENYFPSLAHPYSHSPTALLSCVHSPDLLVTVHIGSLWCAFFSSNQ